MLWEADFFSIHVTCERFLGWPTLCFFTHSSGYLVQTKLPKNGTTRTDGFLPFGRRRFPPSKQHYEALNGNGTAFLLPTMMIHNGLLVTCFFGISCLLLLSLLALLRGVVGLNCVTKAASCVKHHEIHQERRDGWMVGPGSGDCLVVLTFCGLGVCRRDMSIYQSLFLLFVWESVGGKGMASAASCLLWDFVP